MPRYVALLRGVMPTNAKMANLRRCFEAAGFTDVTTVRSSGNVAFDASSRSEAALTRRIEAAMAEQLGRTFYTIVRPTSHLRGLLEADPYAGYRLAANAKRIVTFLRERHEGQLSLPLGRDGARILALKGREVYSAYVPDPRGPNFMVLIEKTFGTNVTTRTWETVQKCAAA
jgi:uncharacterized protein (DUF1697 family)